jgi:PAS domain S-box-containing protein
MKNDLEIILVEDNPNDVLLLSAELKKHYKVVTHKVDCKSDYISVLQNSSPDIILSDYSLPQFDGMLALLLRQQMAPDIPFILVTGSLNEEIAVEVMRSGADDYILKENLSRLCPAIKVAIEKKNITREKKIAEEALKESEEKYRLILETIPNVVVIHTQNEILFANSAALKIFEAASMEQVLKRSLMDYLYPADQGEIQQKLLYGYPQKINTNIVERRLVKFTGEIIFTETISVPIHYFGKDAVQTVVMDISERKLSEEKIKTLIRAVEQNPNLIVITDSKGIIEYVNPRFSEISGYSPEEVIGEKPGILKSGYKTNDEYKSFWETISSGKNWHGEFLNKKKNGELYWESANVSPIVDNYGKITHYVGVSEDITEKKQILQELTVSKEKAEQSDKLKSEFLAQISHEIRSPMNAILNVIALAKEELGEKVTTDINEYFIGADAAGKRLVRTVDLILNVSEINAGIYQPQWEEIDLINDIVENIKHEYSTIVLQKGLEFNIDVALSEAVVYGDKYNIQQVFINLIDNAVKFTNAGKVELNLTKNGSNEIEAKIKDTGIGISSEFLEHIYEPFMQEQRGYSRKFDGNGLGMALVKKYCELNNITINLESEKNKGTTFNLYFHNTLRAILK